MTNAIDPTSENIQNEDANAINLYVIARQLEALTIMVSAIIEDKEHLRVDTYGAV